MMVPWPMAILTLYYGVIATLSAAMLWKVLIGASHRPLIWPMVWFVLSAGAMMGLPFLKAWARGLAIWTSTLLIVATLSVAGLLIASGHPVGALLATVGTAVHVIVIRYLQRPVIKVLFGDASERRL